MKPLYRIRKRAGWWTVTRTDDRRLIGSASSWNSAIDIVCRRLGYGVAYK